MKLLYYCIHSCKLNFYCHLYPFILLLFLLIKKAFYVTMNLCRIYKKKVTLDMMYAISYYVIHYRSNKRFFKIAIIAFQNTDDMKSDSFDEF